VNVPPNPDSGPAGPVSRRPCYLDHAAKVIPAFLGDRLRVLFVPWALKDHDGYTAKARERFAAMGIGLDPLVL